MMLKKNYLFNQCDIHAQFTQKFLIFLKINSVIKNKWHNLRNTFNLIYNFITKIKIFTLLELKN